MESRIRFRELLASPGIVTQACVYDPFSARIAEDCGIQSLGLGGYVMGAHMASSEPLLSVDEVARMTRQLAMVTDLPIMVDAGAGWGEPMHVMHAVRLLELAGASSLHMEDQVYPKRASYHRGIEHIIPAEEMVKKFHAAVNARQDPDMVIIGRTDAFRTHGYDEAIRRARMYVEAGCEALMLFPNNLEDARRAPQDLPGVPLIYVNSTGNKFGRPVVPAATLGEWGWKIASDAISATNVTGRALRQWMTTLSATGLSGLDPAEITLERENIERVIGLHDLYRLEDETVM